MPTSKANESTTVKTNKKKNTFFVEGYLKENNLSLVGDVIRGSVVVAVDEHNTFKVQYYVNKKMKSGDENKDFADIEAMLPEKTTSVAQYLQNVPTANFANASAVATRVWCVGRLEEFVSKSADGKEKSMITYKGSRGGIKSGDSFNPRSTFKIDVYLESKKPETNSEGDETGRYLLSGLVPAYNGSMYRFSFVTAEGDPSVYVNDLYDVGQTVYLEGQILAIRQEVARSSTKNAGWGTAASLPPRTFFTTQLVVFGGNTTPINEDEPGAITKKDVKDGLAVRETEAMENGKKRASKVGPKVTTGTTSFGAEEVISDPNPAPKGNTTTKKSFDFSDF